MNPVVPVILVGVLLFAFQLVWTLRSVRWMHRGDFARARRVFERQQRSWFRTTRDSARYNLAMCSFHEDRLEEALHALLPLDSDEVTPAVREAARGLTASTLLLLGREPGRAAQLLGESKHGILSSARLLQQAQAALMLGHDAAAVAFMEQANATPARSLQLGKLPAVALPGSHEPMTRVVRGMIAEMQGEEEVALREYELAIATGAPGVYVKRARQAVSRLRARA